MADDQSRAAEEIGTNRLMRLCEMLDDAPEVAEAVALAASHPQRYVERHEFELLQRGIEEPADVDPRTDARRGKLIGNTLALVAILLIAAAAIIAAAALAVTDSGRWGTYVLLAIALAMTIPAFLTVRRFRLGLTAARDAGREYIAITRDGLRLAGTPVLWSDICGGLITDERGDTRTHGTARAARMRGIGYSRVEVHLGLRKGLAKQLRSRATPPARRMYIADVISGLRIPLEWAVPPEQIAPVLHGIRVSAALAGVRVVRSTDPEVIHATVMRILGGEQPKSTL